MPGNNRAKPLIFVKFFCVGKPFFRRAVRRCQSADVMAPAMNEEACSMQKDNKKITKIRCQRIVDRNTGVLMAIYKSLIFRRKTPRPTNRQLPFCVRGGPALLRLIAFLYLTKVYNGFGEFISKEH